MMKAQYNGFYDGSAQEYWFLPSVSDIVVGTCNPTDGCAGM